MKIVFVVHYFPPINSSGIRRVLAITKYLARFGHEVSVITTVKKGFDGPPIEPMPDYCQVVQVGEKATPDADPSKGGHQGGMGRTGLMWYLILFRRYLTNIFGQLIDHRVFFAHRFKTKNLPESALKLLINADVVVTSCPPWPVHLAGYYIDKYFGKPWVADYRDHFSGYHFIAGNKFSMWVETKLDAFLLTRAAAVTTISQPMSKYYEQFHKGVITIENGYDAEYIDQLREKLKSNPELRAPSKQNKKVIRYLGSITRDRVPRVLFSVLRDLPSEFKERVVFEFFGESAILQTALLAEFPDVAGYFEFNDRVSYEQSITLMLQADALLFMETSSVDSLSTAGTLTTKLFEYLATNRPVLAEISVHHTIGGIIKKSGLGVVISTDKAEIKDGLMKIIDGKISLTGDEKYVRSYSREVQARRFEELFQKLSEKK
jgi:glycosyltransferase involved in cell wall biosynthesis